MRSPAASFETSDHLFGEAGDGLFKKMVDATRATINGTVLVAAGERLAIVVGYLVAGVPYALTFLILTTAFAMIPFGSWLAFTTAAIVTISGCGSGIAATGVFLWGSAVMLAGDHFVWPALVDGSARRPFLLAFVGIFGGLAAFGLIGLFVGPVIMAALLAIWREWIFRPEPRHEGATQTVRKLKTFVTSLAHWQIRVSRRHSDPPTALRRYAPLQGRKGRP